jgi:CRISPR-associated protein Csh1
VFIPNYNIIDMIKELSQFVNSLDPDFKALGLKPKEGLHILLQIQSDGETSGINDVPLIKWVYTKTKSLNAEELALLNHFATLSQLSWCVNTNKCFDLPTKAIHTCTPYCLAVKRENLVNGEKYLANASGEKSQVYERINTYFAKGFDLLDNESDKQRLEIFKYAINSEDKMHSWLDRIPEFAEMKDAEYVIFYLDEAIEKYQFANAKYLADKLFNTSNYNKTIGGTTYGTSDFFNGFPTKKIFLSHQSASFDISGRVSGEDAKSLYEFQDLMGRNIFPRPLPIFINNEELRNKSIALFKENAGEGGKMGYKEIIERLYENHKSDLGNYYLLFYHMGEIRDFDFVSKFEYELKDENGNAWKVEDLFDCKYSPTVKNVFDFQYLILLNIFNNALVVKTKKGDFQHKYFDEIDSSYCKSDVTYLLVVKYRRAFYDYIFKSQRQAVTQNMFNDILQTSIIEDMRLDEFKNNNHSQYHSIYQKLNIWYSFSEKFDLKNNQPQTMASRLKEHRLFIQQLTKGEASIVTDEQYAFTVGQVIAYLMTKSKTADRSYQRLEPFLQQVKSRELNKAIARMFDTYKHETFSNNFRLPFAEVLAYETTSVRELIPIILAGIFSKNALFSDKDVSILEISESEEKENKE